MLTLYKNYKYDNHYSYIKTFQTKEEQDNYFNSLDKIYADDYEYIREYEPFKVELSHAYLTTQGINYLKFNNGYKDMYAFIVNKVYINDEVTELQIEIDVIQSFMFDFTLKNSFIERKKCTIDEITDFDEGLEIGEHIVDSNNLVFNKESQWFAMFNGIKEQALEFNNDGKIIGSVDIPFYTSKPLTLIDNVQYPLYFMPLRETYKAAMLNTKPIWDSGIDVTTSEGTNVPSNALLTSARKLLGLPYVWGGNYGELGNIFGNKSNGTDCSGLVQWAYYNSGNMEKVGLSGRWTTYTINEHGIGVELEMAVPGDVVLSNFSSPGVPEHVALISDVNIMESKLRIIEAPYEGVPIREIWINYNPIDYDIRRLI